MTIRHGARSLHRQLHDLASDEPSRVAQNSGGVLLDNAQTLV